ncbi:helix-turn-helix domain containing protein [Tsukamurella sp. 8F]|uniref:TetR/AcrR family transcriptional regulator n=1 Tax=unclassified Tsukamurella TaxID=2633480 RepID=UPI0023B89178|nr:MULTISPECIES: TetR/AcrR family transcriptional regulator [unclassified Tsukamurella]MDF0529701.1 helix-turn-helix domain containing protein [Tsukamurella sp. 8J]MDF0585986.1 helix-turn-helix domain containing protein [Tsukamurella sp. 8F]
MDTSEAAERAREARREIGGRRDELLFAAEHCFAQDGYDRTTAASITARASTSRPTFYAYFASKDEVFHALTARASDALVAAQLVVDVEAVAPHDVLEATTRAFVEALFEHAPLLALVEHRARIDPVVDRLWTGARDITRRRFTRFLERLAAEGAADPCVPAARIVDTVADALTIGAARIAGTSAAERERFIADHIIITERLVGVSPRTEEL